MPENSDNNRKEISNTEANKDIFDEDELSFVQKEKNKFTKDILDSSKKNTKKFNW